MKRIVSIISVLAMATTALAQSRSFDDFKQKQNARFEQFQMDKQAEFDAFRKKQNERYAEFMKHNWESFNAQPAVIPEEEKKVPPVVYEVPITTPTTQPTHTPPTLPMPKEDSNPILVKNEVIVVPQPQPIPEPIAPVEPKKELPYKPYAIAFYGTLVSIGFPTNDIFRLNGLSEQQLSEAWVQLSSEAYDITLKNVLDARKNLALCDWGYVKMLQAISEKKYGNTNEAVFMQTFLLSQSGYKVRLATDNQKLYLLIASQYSILSMIYYVIDNTKFYALNCKSKSLNICNASFDNEKSISLQLRNEQNLEILPTPPRKLTSKYGITANVTTNKNTIDFFNDYPSAYINNDPTTCWAVYANTPLDQSIKNELYPALKQQLNGLSEYDAVNTLLNFVQTAFVYEYDNKVWGHDRAFFAAETLHYPYADCEDRSILFSRLVRDILGLDVVLLYYPGHLATAVAFTKDVEGDYLMYKNRKYIIADPTYINASVGMTMPDMNNQEARIIAL
ncbi:MAG: hypothetical protein IIU55_01935 [Paludibacteraceae bacterium]|nr:hypothetical protein [Paludibacteraceae bacterium]